MAADGGSMLDRLPVPLALENVAAPLTWPEDTAEADFIAELLDRAGALLVLDVANFHPQHIAEARAIFRAKEIRTSAHRP